MAISVWVEKKFLETIQKRSFCGFKILDVITFKILETFKYYEHFYMDIENKRFHNKKRGVKQHG